LFKKKIISDNDEEDDDYEYICDENGKKPSISSASIKNDNSSEISTKDKNVSYRNIFIFMLIYTYVMFLSCKELKMFIC
jgi:hypothetical protein